MTVSFQPSRSPDALISNRVAGLTIGGAAPAGTHANEVMDKATLATILGGSAPAGTGPNPVTLGVLAGSLNASLAVKSVRNLRVAGRGQLSWRKPTWRVPTKYRVLANDFDDFGSAQLLTADRGQDALAYSDSQCRHYWVVPAVNFGWARARHAVCVEPPEPDDRDCGPPPATLFPLVDPGPASLAPAAAPVGMLPPVTLSASAATGSLPPVTVFTNRTAGQLPPLDLAPQPPLSNPPPQRNLAASPPVLCVEFDNPRYPDTTWSPP